MAKEKKGLVKRRITFGVMLATVALSLLGWDFASGRSFGFAVLVAIALSMGVAEMLRMLRAVGGAAGSVPAVTTALAMVFLPLARRELGWDHVPAAIDALVLVLYLLLLGGGALRDKPSKDRLVGLALTTFGVVYILGLGAFAIRLRYVDELLRPSERVGRESLGTWLVLYAIAMAKGTDVFAFFIGRAFGKRKMIPHVSPGKTWAGGVGALLGALAIGLGFSLFTSVSVVVSWQHAVPLALLLGMATMVGDLIESFVKRSAAVKDSGGLVPEFGGVLDIIDSVLYVLPIVYTIALFKLGR